MCLQGVKNIFIEKKNFITSKSRLPGSKKNMVCSKKSSMNMLLQI